MKVILLGKKGLLGSCFLKELAASEDFEMYAFDKDDLDVGDFRSIEKVFKEISPDFVINCAAYTDVDGCETEKQLAYRINAEAPGIIARASKLANAIMVHFSTDYIFNGKSLNPYDENAKADPLNYYGETKLEAEKRIKDEMDEYYIIRTSWMFGAHGKNFVDTIIELIKKGEPIKVVDDQYGCPTYTKDLSRAVIGDFLHPYTDCVERHHELSLDVERLGSTTKLPFGIYHLTNDGSCNWFEFADEIVKLVGKQVELKPVESEGFVREAVRPKFSVLKNTKLPKLRSWKEALKAYLGLEIGHLK